MPGSCFLQDSSPEASTRLLSTCMAGPSRNTDGPSLDEFQVEAGEGFAVIYCNPRGSSGREDAFARAILGAPGEPDSADILATVDAAVARYPLSIQPGWGLLVAVMEAI